MAKVSHAGPSKDPKPAPTAIGGRILVLTRPFGLPPDTGPQPVFRLYVGRHRRSLEPA